MSQFGRYVLRNKIASGGMGEVYLAHVEGDEGFSRPVALKRIYPHLSHSERYRKLFIQEAKCAATLQHPSIVQVYDLGCYDDWLFIAMEYVAGPSLYTLLKTYQEKDMFLNPQLSALVTFDVLDALDYLHTRHDDQGEPLHWLHRDISPHNILINVETGFAKVCDFGLIWVANQTQVTANSVWGKMLYMSPEQKRGEALNATADIYSTGMVLLEMLLGHHINKDIANSENYYQHVENFMRDKTATASSPEPLLRLLHNCLCVDPAKRLQTAAAARTIVEDYLLAQGPRQIREQMIHCLKHDFPPTTKLPKNQHTQKISDTTRWTQLITQAQSRPKNRPEISVTPNWPERFKYKFVISCLCSVGLFILWYVFQHKKTSQPQAIVTSTLTEQLPAPAMIQMPEEKTTIEAPKEKLPRPAITVTRETYGYLNLNARPWAYVAINGKRLKRTTPLQKYRIRSGKHVIEFMGPSGQKNRQTLVVGTNETVTKIIDFEQPEASNP